MRRLYSGVIALFIAVGLTLAMPSAALAAPDNCTVSPYPPGQMQVMGAYCSGGTGEFRIALTCNTGQTQHSPNYFVYGNWRAVDSTWSTASCGHAQMRGLQIQIR